MRVGRAAARSPPMRAYVARQLVQLVVVVVGDLAPPFAVLHVIGDPVLRSSRSTPARRSSSATGSSSASTSRSGSSTGASRARRSRATSGSPGTPTRRPSAWCWSGCRRRSTSRWPAWGSGSPIALPLGILAALQRHSLVDNLCTAVAVAGQAMPLFWLGIMLIIVFAVRLRAAPGLRLRDLAALRDADVLPGRLPGPGADAPRPVGHDRGHEHGLHQDRPRQGGAGVRWSWSSTPSATRASRSSPCSASSSASSSAAPSSPRRSSPGRASPR